MPGIQVRIDQDALDYFKSIANERGVSVQEAILQVADEHETLTFWEKARQSVRRWRMMTEEPDRYRERVEAGYTDF